MAVTVTTVLAGANTFIADVEATADADTTTGNVAHGLGVIPLVFILTPLLAAARLSLWIMAAPDATNAVATKATTGGSGAAGAQVRMIVMRPHSIIK